MRDGKPGRRVESKDAKELCYTPVVFGKVIVAATPGALLGLDPRTLEKKWRLPIGDVFGMEADGDTVFVGETGPNLLQIDAETGAQVWSYGYRQTTKQK
jgi:outer membrane protein assembly factor BamB